MPTREVVDQLHIANKEVGQQLGAKIEVVLPVRRPNSNRTSKAMVHITQLLTILKIAEAWFPNSNKYWDIREKEQMDKALLPYNSEDEPVTAASLAATTQKLRKTLKAEENINIGVTSQTV